MNNPSPPLPQPLCEVSGLLDWLEHALPQKLGHMQHVETVKQRPWSQVYRLQAERDVAYFKICGADRQQEVALLQWMQPEYAAIIPEVLALDAEKGWILMADGGVPLRELLQAKADGDLPSEEPSPEERLRPDRLRHCTATLLNNYAKLQIHSLLHTDALLKMQLPDHRLYRLPDLVQNLLLTGTRKDWFDAALVDQVLDTLPRLTQLCQVLSGTAYSAALEHGDLHAGNILLKAGQPRICDWGDAWVSHPFCSLFPLLQSSFSPEGTLVFQPNTEKLINAYLEPWKQFERVEILRSHVIKALYIGIVLRALNIANALAQTDEPAMRRWSPCIAEYLKHWVQGSPQIEG